MKIVKFFGIFIVSLFCIRSYGVADDTFPTTITIKQRCSEKLAAFKDRIAIGLGDITAEQVPVQVEDLKATRSLHDPVSLKKFDKISFDFQGTKYFVQVVEMRNFLLGSDDNADILVTDNEKDLRTPPAKDSTDADAASKSE